MKHLVTRKENSAVEVKLTLTAQFWGLTIVTVSVETSAKTVSGSKHKSKKVKSRFFSIIKWFRVCANIKKCAHNGTPF